MSDQGALLTALRGYATRIATELSEAAKSDPAKPLGPKTDILSEIATELNKNTQQIVFGQANLENVTSQISSIRASVQSHIQKIKDAIQNRAEAQRRTEDEADQLILDGISAKLTELSDAVDGIKPESDSAAELDAKIAAITAMPNSWNSLAQTVLSYEDMRNARFAQSVHKW